MNRKNYPEHIRRAPWTPDENTRLIQMWPAASWTDLLAAFPTHNMKALYKRASTLGLQRSWHARPRMATHNLPYNAQVQAEIAERKAADLRTLMRRWPEISYLFVAPTPEARDRGELPR